MKVKFVIRILLLAIILVTFSSCTGSDSAMSPGQIKCLINGIQWSAVGNAAIDDRGAIIIDGTDATEKEVRIYIQSEKTGVYNLKGNYSDGFGAPEHLYVNNITYNGMSSQNFVDAEVVGSVVFTEIDLVSKTISGAFSSRILVIPGDLLDNAEGSVTEGVFSKIAIFTRPVGVGDHFSGNVAAADVATDSVFASRDHDDLNITASLGSGRLFLKLPYRTTPGKYSFIEDGAFEGEFVPSGAYEGISLGGTIVVTKFDLAQHRVEATFEVAGLPGFSIKNASFEVTYF